MSGPPPVMAMLEQQGLARFWPRFQRNEIYTLEIFKDLSETEMAELVPPIGPRRDIGALIDEINKVKPGDACLSGHVWDTPFARPQGDDPILPVAAKKPQKKGEGHVEISGGRQLRSAWAIAEGESWDGNAVGGGGNYATGEGDPHPISKQLQDRQDARRAKDYPKADAIRDQLTADGIQFDDDARTWVAPDGTAGGWGPNLYMPVTTGNEYGGAGGGGRGGGVKGVGMKMKGLPFKCRFDEIREFFGWANIEIVPRSAILEYGEDGRKTGVGFVKLASQDDFEKAKSELNDQPFKEGEERTIRLYPADDEEYAKAKASEPRPAGPGDSQPISIKCRARQDARRANDYDKADAIRGELEALGVKINEQSRSWTHGDKSGTWGDATPEGDADLSGVEVAAAPAPAGGGGGGDWAAANAGSGGDAGWGSGGGDAGTAEPGTGWGSGGGGDADAGGGGGW